jgi:hypothetical protein
MRARLPLLVGAATFASATFAAVGFAMPAAQAATPVAVSPASIPAGCTLGGSTNGDIYNSTATCDLPGQSWYLELGCRYKEPVELEDYYGNTVDGDGTSTAHCPNDVDWVMYEENVY